MGLLLFFFSMTLFYIFKQTIDLYTNDIHARMSNNR